MKHIKTAAAKTLLLNSNNGQKTSDAHFTRVSRL